MSNPCQIVHTVYIVFFYCTLFQYIGEPCILPKSVDLSGFFN